MDGAGCAGEIAIMPDILLRPWPWYVTGPLLGLFAPLLLWLGNRLFGVSSNLRHLCAAIAPRGIPYLSYDRRRPRWRRSPKSRAGRHRGGHEGDARRARHPRLHRTRTTRAVRVVEPRH